MVWVSDWTTPSVKSKLSYSYNLQLAARNYQLAASILPTTSRLAASTHRAQGMINLLETLDGVLKLANFL